MRTQDKNTIKTFILAGVLALGASLATAWTAPTADPPGNNSLAAINESSVAQFKAGSLKVGDDICPGIDGVMTVCGAVNIDGGISSETSAVIVQKPEGGSRFEIGISEYDLINENADLIIDGYLRAGESAAAEASLHLDGTARIEKLAKINNDPSIVYPAAVCLDAAGDFELCDNL